MTAAFSRLVPGLALVLGASACAPEPVAVELNFPSLESFLFTEVVRLRVFGLSADDLGACPNLVQEAVAGDTRLAPEVEAQPVTACSARSGGIAIDEVGPGPKAFLAVATDLSKPLLVGCTVAEVYVDAPRITVDMFMTREYRLLAESVVPGCTTIEDKCERGCR